MKEILGFLALCDVRGSKRRVRFEDGKLTVPVTDSEDLLELAGHVADVRVPIEVTFAGLSKADVDQILGTLAAPEQEKPLAAVALEEKKQPRVMAPEVPVTAILAPALAKTSDVIETVEQLKARWPVAEPEVVDCGEDEAAVAALFTVTPPPPPPAEPVTTYTPPPPPAPEVVKANKAAAKEAVKEHKPGWLEPRPARAGDRPTTLRHWLEDLRRAGVTARAEAVERAVTEANDHDFLKSIPLAKLRDRVGQAFDLFSAERK